MFREKNIFITILVSLGIVILVVVIGFVFYTPEDEKEITEINDWKTYRNEEFGFEFWYPANLILKEKTFASYYSRFNLEIFTKTGDSFDSTFLVNIVLPEFTDHSFTRLEKTASEVVVAGVPGIKYEYEYQGFSHTAVIVPIGELKMILATGDGSRRYLDEFNQILATFKFFK